MNALGIALTINQPFFRIRARCCDVAEGLWVRASSPALVLANRKTLHKISNLFGWLIALSGPPLVRARWPEICWLCHSYLSDATNLVNSKVNIGDASVKRKKEGKRGARDWRAQVNIYA